MKLNVLERIMTLSVLPNEANYVTLKILDELRGKLSFSEDEIKELSIVTEVDPNGKSHYEWKKNEEREIEIGDVATAIIVKQLENLDKDGKISSNTKSIYEKFVLKK